VLKEIPEMRMSVAKMPVWHSPKFFDSAMSKFPSSLAYRETLIPFLISEMREYIEVKFPIGLDYAAPKKLKR